MRLLRTTCAYVCRVRSCMLPTAPGGVAPMLPEFPCPKRKDRCSAVLPCSPPPPSLSLPCVRAKLGGVAQAFWGVGACALRCCRFGMPHGTSHAHKRTVAHKKTIAARLPGNYKILQRSPLVFSPFLTRDPGALVSAGHSIRGSI